MNKLLVFLFIVATATAASINDPEVALPEYFKICSRNAADRDDCIRDSIQSIVPNLKSGHKELGIAPLDPNVVEDFKLSYDQNSVRAKITTKNVVTTGMSDIKVKAVRSQVSDNAVTMEVDVFFPTLRMEGQYKGQGKINAFELNSRGFLNVTMTGVSTTWRIRASPVEQNGQTYMHVDEFKMSPEVEDMKFYLTGLFTDPELNNFANEFANQNWKLMYAEMLPYAEKIWDPIMSVHANSVMMKIPFKRLFPEN